jgi:glycolate oxidase iron-sulfur subunit
MQTHLADWAKAADHGDEADAILRRCAHCGFCLSACSTFQLTGDELDSPRGRIYRMKLVLEGEAPTPEIQQHLDRCLTCHACETVCPSGVEYGALVDIGRRVVAERVRRPFRERVLRRVLRQVMRPPWFGLLYRMGRGLRPALPGAFKAKFAPVRPADPLPADSERHVRQVLLLSNCVQPVMLPSVDAATRRVLDAVGIGTRYAAGSGCCGAVNFHLDAPAAARRQMRANVDAWLPLLESGACEAVVANASGCGGMLKDHARHPQYDPVYGSRARRLMPYIKDVAEVLAPMTTAVRARMRRSPGRCAFHVPCTLQHWQGLRGLTEHLLRDLGFDLLPVPGSDLCCGSAGTYSIPQPKLSRKPRDRKLGVIAAAHPELIVSANVGCVCHLQGGTSTPVRHWIEAIDAALRD